MSDLEIEALERLEKASRWTDGRGEPLDNVFVVASDLRTLRTLARQAERYREALERIRAHTHASLVAVNVGETRRREAIMEWEQIAASALHPEGEGK